MTLAELRAERGYKIAVADTRIPTENDPPNQPDSFEYLARDGSYWRVNKRFPTLPSLPHDLPSEQDLLTAQLALSSKRTAIPDDLYNSNHSKTIQFFLQNWWKMRDIFIPPPEAAPVTPRCYAEVDFGELGRADFIGVCSDGSLAIIEFGLSSKAPQVALHAFGVSQYLNSDTMPIYPFTARYSTSGKDGITVDVSQVNGISISGKREADIRLIPKKDGDNWLR